MATLQDLIDAVDALQSAVTNLTAEVNVRKANLDSAINLANDAKDGAEDARDGAEDARDEAFDLLPLIYAGL